MTPINSYSPCYTHYPHRVINEYWKGSQTGVTTHDLILKRSDNHAATSVIVLATLTRMWQRAQKMS